MASELFKRWTTDDGLLMLRSWARDGLTEKQIADKIGITTRTLYNWKQKYKAVNDALLRGKDVYDNEAVEALRNSAVGYWVDEYTETQTEFGDTKTVRTHRYIKPNVTALIFWLTNRRPEDWSDRRVRDTVGNDEKKSGVVILPELKIEN